MIPTSQSSPTAHLRILFLKWCRTTIHDVPASTRETWNMVEDTTRFAWKFSWTWWIVIQVESFKLNQCNAWLFAVAYVFVASLVDPLRSFDLFNIIICLTNGSIRQSWSTRCNKCTWTWQKMIAWYRLNPILNHLQLVWKQNFIHISPNVPMKSASFNSWVHLLAATSGFHLTHSTRLPESLEVSWS